MHIYEHLYTPLGVGLRDGIDYCLYCCVEELWVGQGTKAVVHQAFTLAEGHI